MVCCGFGDKSDSKDIAGWRRQYVSVEGVTFKCRSTVVPQARIPPKNCHVLYVENCDSDSLFTLSSLNYSNKKRE